MSVRLLYGIGKMAAARLSLVNINTVADLDNYILSHTDVELRRLVRDISANERAHQCLEGYMPRKYNKMIYDGLVDHIRSHRPLQIDDYGTWRITDPSRQVLRCGSQPMMVDWDLQDGVTDSGTIIRQGHPWTGGRYAKSCKLPATLSNADRDRLIRNNFAYKAKRKYQCSCFQSERTCSDFGLSRGNRMRGSGLPYCEWTGGVCRDI